MTAFFKPFLLNVWMELSNAPLSEEPDEEGGGGGGGPGGGGAAGAGGGLDPDDDDDLLEDFLLELDLLPTNVNHYHELNCHLPIWGDRVLQYKPNSQLTGSVITSTENRSLSTGSRTLSTGSSTLSTGSSTLSAGSRTLSTGSRTLSTGSRTLSTEKWTTISWYRGIAPGPLNTERCTSKGSRKGVCSCKRTAVLTGRGCFLS